MSKKQKILLGLVVAAFAVGLGARYTLRKHAGALTLGVIGKLFDKGPKKADVVRAATGEGKALEDAFINNHKALMDGNWEEFKKWTRAENVKQIETAGGATTLPLLRAMTPAQVTVKAAVVAGETGTVTVEGEVLGKKETGMISLVLEDGRWKVAEMSWNIGDIPSTGAAVAVSASPIQAGEGETDMDVNFFCKTSNFKGTITLNGSHICVFGNKGKSYSFGCPAFFDKVRYGENTLDLEYASLADASLPHQLEIKVARYDKEKKQPLDIKVWNFTQPKGGKERLSFSHARPGAAPAPNSVVAAAAPQPPLADKPPQEGSLSFEVLQKACSNEINMLCQEAGDDKKALLACLHLNKDGLLSPCRKAAAAQ